jgi:hypothetical protein
MDSPKESKSYELATPKVAIRFARLHSGLFYCVAITHGIDLNFSASVTFLTL